MTWEERLSHYDKIVTLTNIIERKGKTMPYTSSNGYMFSMLNKAGELGVRLPKEIQEKMKQEHGATIFKSYNSVMKDYVLIPEPLLADAAEVAKLIEKGYEFVNSLPPK